MTFRSTLCRVAILAASLLIFPSAAPGADTTTTGIAAGLGLSAAGGKTTISNGGGVTEAAILNSQAVVKAGSVVRRLAEAAAGQHSRILVLGHSDSLDFVTARSLQMRLDDLRRAQPPASQCKRGMMRIAGGSQVQGVAVSSTSRARLVPAPNDITAALATDVTIQGITVSTDDRLLIEAILMGASSPQWEDADSIAPTATTNSRTHIFSVPADNIDIGPNNELILDFLALKRAAGANRDCDSAAYKAWLSEAQAFEASVMASEKGGAAPLATAAELLALSPTNAKPLVLRVAVEQSGGTAITKSNIFYTLGFPGGATVSSGLLVSFRLTDPVAGTALLTGIVRCAADPTRFQNVKKFVAGQAPANVVKCSAVAA